MDAAALSCRICNKNPQFSDLSHLLTHVSSKAHLANYFKLQVKSHHDRESHKVLVQYDQWYEENELAKLLSDRMASSSKTTRRGRSSRRFDSEIDTTPSQLSFHIPDDKIDPRLSDGRQSLTLGENIKSEFVSSETLYDPFERHFLKAEPQSPLWPESSMVGFTESKEYSLATKYNPFSLTMRPKTPTSRSENTQFTGSYFESFEESKVDDMARLKGVQWPGMDVFDAASDVMKRQRNQKKDASTFKAMEKASCATEPNEMVFSPSGTLRREREITGFVEEEDLLPGEWAIPKHRRERRDRRDRPNRESTVHSGQGSQRIALSVTDPNRSVLGSRIVKREHQLKKQFAENRGRREYALRSTSLRNRNQGLSHGHSYSANDDNIDLQLSVGTTTRSRASRINIFKDDDSAAADTKPNSPAPDIVENKTPRGEQPNLLHHQRTGDAVHSLLTPSDPAILPTGSQHYSHNRASAPRELCRNVEGIYLVDTSLGPTYRVPFDPLVGGNVLHYRWDWNVSNSARGDDSEPGGNIFYSRAASSDTAIYQDESENKSCLWLDGYSR